MNSKRDDELKCPGAKGVERVQSQSSIRLSVDQDDEVIHELAVTKSAIELTDMEKLNRVGSFSPPPDEESNRAIVTENEMENIDEAERLKAEGNELMRLGTNFQGAVLAYSKAISLHKNNFVLYNNRAAAHIINGDFQKAIDDCNTSLRISSNPKAFCRRGLALGRLHRYDEALESVGEALKMKPRDKESISVKNSLIENVATYKETCLIDELKKEGNENLQTQDFQKAVHAYTKALAISKNNYVVYNNRAVAFLMTEDYDRAIEDCDRSLAIKKNSKAYCRKAQALRKSDRVEDALSIVNCALKLNANDREALRLKDELLKDQEVYESDAMLFYGIKEQTAGDIVLEWMEGEN